MSNRAFSERRPPISSFLGVCYGRNQLLRSAGSQCRLVATRAVSLPSRARLFTARRAHVSLLTAARRLLIGFAPVSRLTAARAPPRETYDGRGPRLPSARPPRLNGGPT